MAEVYVERVHNAIVVDIGDDIGALIIYTDEALRGRQIDVSLKGYSAAKRIHTMCWREESVVVLCLRQFLSHFLKGEYVTGAIPCILFTLPVARLPS